MLLKLKPFPIVIFFLSLALNCEKSKKKTETKSQSPTMEINKKVISKDTFIYREDYVATKFDFPVGKPDSKGYYNAQKFGKNDHLGDDWNGINGGNSDLGDPIYTIANGYVNFTKNIEGGWGNVIRITHKLNNGKMIESLYAHCDTILVKPNQWIKKGTQIGTIGNAGGIYYAHLHFEIRDQINLSIGVGYSNEIKGYLDPTEFIKNHR